MDSKDKVINDLLSRIAKLEYEVERLNNIIEEQDKELELERKSRQLFIDNLANVCEMSLKKDNIIKEVREELKKIDSATYQGDTDKKAYYKYEQTRIQKLLEILDKADKENK